MESLDDTMFNEWISDWEEGSTMSNFDDNTWTIIKGYFLIHLILKLENKIKEESLKEFNKLKERDLREEGDISSKTILYIFTKTEINRKREEEEKQKQKQLNAELGIKNINKVNEKNKKKIDEENKKFENNIIKKIKENESNIVFFKITSFL